MKNLILGTLNFSRTFMNERGKELFERKKTKKNGLSIILGTSKK